jgi:hypothetical protein
MSNRCCRNENFLRHMVGKSEACEKLQNNSILKRLLNTGRGNVNRMHKHRADIRWNLDLTDKGMLITVFWCQYVLNCPTRKSDTKPNVKFMSDPIGHKIYWIPLNVFDKSNPVSFKMSSNINHEAKRDSTSNHVQWNPVKKILKIPRKSYFLSGKFLKRVILMKWENFSAFLSWLLRWEIFLTAFFLSEFHCTYSKIIYYTYNWKLM